ncbi:hypothetical protein DFH09DRAFT_1457485 [Mycena vulgaris]|nr:hypothetical protein DFH09DRAFT_1457485 [Mycena vulgaris]
MALNDAGVLSLVEGPLETAAKVEGSRIRPRLAEITRHIASFESQLARLHAERDGILKQLDSIVYPILSIPPEVTSEIFFHSVDIRRPDLRFPLQLASVCRAWRIIALSTPRLWTSFYAHSSYLCGPDPEKLSSFLQFWLPRTGSLPLDLKIPLPKLAGAGAGAAMDQILSILAKYSSQWSTLRLHAAGLISFPTDSIRGCLTSLRRLELIITSCPPGGAITAFRDAPNLRELRIEGISAAQLCLPWIQLTALELVNADQEEACMECLKLTPNLEILTVYPSYFFQQHAPTPITLPCLHTLKISFPWTLLDNLTLPALEDLELSSSSSTDYAAPLDSFLMRSGCSIKKLHMISMTYGVAYQCICSLPSLRDLTLRFPHWSTEELGDVFDEIRDNVILPALESLHINYFYGHDIEVCPLVGMLVARWAGSEGAPKITSFRLSFQNGNSDEDVESALEQLSDLRAQGLQMKFYGAPWWDTRNITAQMIAELERNPLP